VSSSIVAGLALAAGLGIVAAPYLARLTLSVPEDDNRSWWRGKPVTPRRVAVLAGLGAGLGALAGATAGWTALLPALVWLEFSLAVLFVVDIEHHRLPNRLVFATDAGAIALLALAAGVRDEWHAALRALEGAAAVFGVLIVLCLISPKAFGYGDVKLGGLLGGYLGWYGWFYVYYGIFAGFLLGAVVGVGMILARRGGLKSQLPFGPSMIVGALVVLAFDLVPATYQR
jgi:leader peptidase (prepilin peptidase)/N-methyltransferase